MDDRYRLPRGRQVYDAYNGARVGGLAGALLGAILAALTTPAMAWAILAGAALGAPLGYLWERSRIRSELEAGRSRAGDSSDHA